MAIKVKPLFVNPYNNLELFSTARTKEKAIEYFEKVVELDPKIYMDIIILVWFMQV